MPRFRLAALCLALAACATAPITVAPATAPKPPPEHLADCLARTGAHLYGASWCHWCHKQLSLFGADASKVPYTDCDPKGDLTMLPECEAKGFDLASPFPTWILGDGTRVVGVRSPQWLAEKTGCPAP